MGDRVKDLGVTTSRQKLTVVYTRDGMGYRFRTPIPVGEKEVCVEGLTYTKVKNLDGDRKQNRSKKYFRKIQDTRR